MSKSITEQIENLQKENEHLREYEKLFEKALKYEFGVGRKIIRKKLSEDAEKGSDFEKKICSFFDLKSEEDKAAFITVMCGDSSLRFFRENRKSMTDSE